MLTESHEALAREVLIHGPIGRGALGRRLGLSPASLTRLAKPFLERGLFVELGEESTGSVGRPVRPLDIAPDLGSFAGIKVTGDTLYAVLTDARARPLAEREVALDGISPEAVVAVLAELVSGFSSIARAPLVGVGVSLGGAVDDAGRVIRAPFLDWTNVDLGPALESAARITVTVENDVVALVEAERWFGAGR
ncbi:ROK family protein, partial [Microbacterium sp.]|uniref:ROK family protein n=1 Tax=Microbacterium sp. TaxID=51671 RepID=UPI002E2F2224